MNKKKTVDQHIADVFGVPAHQIVTDEAADQFDSTMPPPQCASLYQNDDGLFACLQIPNHPGDHRWWDDYNNKVIWPGDDFLSPETSVVVGCQNTFTDAEGITYQCWMKDGHSGQHGHPNSPEDGVGNGIPVYWPQQAAVNGWKSPKHGYAAGEAAFEIVIPTGKVAVAGKVRLNGLEIPNVRSLTVNYDQGDARTVTLEIYATDIEEVPQ